MSRSAACYVMWRVLNLFVFIASDAVRWPAAYSTHRTQLHVIQIQHFVVSE